MFGLFTGLPPQGASGSRLATASTLACFALAAVFCAFVVHEEVDWFFILPVLGAFVAVAALMLALTLRLRLAILASLALFASIWVADASKYALLAMHLHVYDVIFHFSPSQAQFAYSAFPLIAWSLTAGVVAAAALLVVAWRGETPVRLRGRRLAVGVGALALACLTWLPLAGRNAQYFSAGRFVFSAFLSSLGDLPQLVRYNGLIEVAAAATAAPVNPEPITCSPQTTPPDIVFFLNESAMPPGVYPGLHYPEELTPYFASADAQIHPLRVETFGGGTWLSDFTAITGLSTRSFGSMRNFVANFMTGRLRHSLPQYLKACGYETHILYPASADFAGVGRFYKAIGFDEVLDAHALAAPNQRQRDAFYLAAAAKILQANAASARPKPQFIALSSMSTHSPWDFRFAPEAVRQTDVMRWNADAEFDEYLWRLVLAKRDRDDFRRELANTMPNRKILHVAYGDHQPALAKIPLADNLAIADEGRSWQLDPTSRAFQTYYSIEAQGFIPTWPGADLPLVELSHLATLTVMAAGLPLDPVYERRLQLLQTCHGLYATCADRPAVLTFQRWLVDNQWLSQGGVTALNAPARPAGSAL